MGFCVVSENLDLLQVLPDFLEAGRIGDGLVLVFKIVHFLANLEYSLGDAVVGENGWIAAVDELIL